MKFCNPDPTTALGHGMKLVSPSENKEDNMGHTVVGFFKDVIDVQKAVQQLESKGISNQHVDISKGKHQDSSFEPDGKKTNRISEFFNKLFGHDSDDAKLYSTIGQQDVHILTVHALSGDMAETAAETLDDCGALDVDEQSARSTYNHGGRGTDSTRAASEKDSSDKYDQPGLKRDSSRSPRNTSLGEDRSLSYRDDYANTLSSENPVRDINEPTNLNDDPTTERGPGTFGVNSDYIDERSYPGDRTNSGNDNRSGHRDSDVNMRNPIEESGGRERSVGNMGAASNDNFSRAGTRQAGYNNESGTRAPGAGFSGQDMTNDGISSPYDDQRTINQNNPEHERLNMISDEETPGLETRVPSAQEQLYRAKRKSRIINASIDEDYRLRE